MTLTDDLYHIAEHIGDDQPNLPVGAKNTLLLAAKRIEGLDEQLAVCRAFIAHREAAAKHDAKRIEELEAIMPALTRWADAKRRLDQAIDSRSPDECDYWYDEIAAAEKELLEQLKETDDDDNA